MTSNPYRHGLDRLAGIVLPTSDRVMLRAIMQTDQSTLHMAKTDTRKAVCHEITRCGPDVKNLSEGMHCLHISAAGDGLDPGEESRHMLVREEDVVAYWWPAEAEALALLIDKA